MRLFKARRAALAPPETPEGPDTTDDALEAAQRALEDSQAALEAGRDRWEPVKEQTVTLDNTLRHNHLAERLEYAMALRKPRHA